MTSASTSNTAGSGSNATSESFTYNDRGQVLTASGSAGSTSYGYNGDGLVTSVADAAGTTSYTYDDADRLSTLANPVTGTTATYSYNPDSLVDRDFLRGGQRQPVVRVRQPAPADLRHAQVILRRHGRVGRRYGYDADSEITSEATTGLAGAASNTYTYDEAGRLTSWNNGTTTTAYGYDNNGNLTQDGSKTYTYDARDELTSDGTEQLRLHRPRHPVVASQGRAARWRRRSTPTATRRPPGPARTPTTRWAGWPPTRRRPAAATRSPTSARPARWRPTGRRPTRGTRPGACSRAAGHPAAGPAGRWR